MSLDLDVPDFVVAGAARCGTTALHDALAAHPRVRMTRIKEPNFFLFRPGPDGPEPLIGPDRALLAKSVSDPSAYARLFPAGDGVTGDVSPLYLYAREAPALLAERRPDLRVVVVLRDPADRAFSHFLSTFTGPPATAVEAFRQAALREWDEPYSPYVRGTHVLRLGRYAEQLRRYEAVFPRERLLVLRSAELAADHAAGLRRVLRFVGVADDDYAPASTRSNRAGVPTSSVGRLVERSVRAAQPYVKRAVPGRLVPAMARVREWQRKKLTGAQPRLPAEMRSWLLADYYDDDLRELADRWGVELSEAGRARRGQSLDSPSRRAPLS